jgi:hypothetical protein
MAKRMGRPQVPKKEALAKVFAVRLRYEEAQQVTAAIRASGKKKPDWLRSAILAAVEKE